MSHSAGVVTDRPTASVLTFGGAIRSEWIKLFSLRSTIWCYAILVPLMIGPAILFAAVVSQPTGLTPDAQQANWVLSSTLGVTFGQLVVAVLGVLVISGEFGTGMIRSTFTAVPRRLPALVAKAVVIAVVTFVVALVSIVAAALLPSGLLPAAGIEPDFGDLGVWWALVGGAGYLALLAVLALAVGAIVRNSAGGLATVFGLILVLPGVLSAFAGITASRLVQDIASFLPAAAGQRMFAYVSGEGDAQVGNFLLFEPWQGLLVLATWVAVLGSLAAVLIRRRDV